MLETGKIDEKRFSDGLHPNSEGYDLLGKALVEVLKEINNFRDNGIKQDEIKFMQRSIGQADARNYETGAQKAAFIGRMIQYDLPADYVKKQNEILQQITKAEIDGLSKKYLDTKKMTFLMDESNFCPMYTGASSYILYSAGCQPSLLC